MHFQTSFSKMMNFLSEFLLNFGFNFQNFGSFSEPPTTNFFLKISENTKTKRLETKQKPQFQYYYQCESSETRYKLYSHYFP